MNGSNDACSDPTFSVAFNLLLDVSVTNGSSSFCRARTACEPIAEGKGRGKRQREKAREGSTREGTGKSQSLQVTAAPLVQTSPVALLGHFFPLQRTRHASKTRAVSTATRGRTRSIPEILSARRLAR